ncbi:MAG: SDR family NAD(P)-dependent oxidoreductase [Archangium sp.]
MRVFVTGSADGLGQLTAQTLIAAGHEVVVHVRAKERLSAVQKLCDRGAKAVIADLADLKQTIALAEQVNALGTMDSVIHNAGVYSSGAIHPVNTLAPYVLTALMHRPKRLVYLSSGLHSGGTARLDGIDWKAGSYSDSKLFVSTLAAAIARLWPDTLSNSVNPGWVPTKMGGRGAPDDLTLGHRTQEWLATSDDAKAKTTGGYWFHQQRVDAHRSVGDQKFQAALLTELERVTKIALPK